MTDGRESHKPKAEPTPEAQEGAPESAAPPDLPSEADAAAYFGLLGIAAAADMDQELDEDARDYGDQEALERIPSRSLLKWFILFGLFLLAVVTALIAGRLVGNRSDPATDTPPAAAGAVASTNSTPSPSASTDRAGAGADCVLPASSVTSTLMDVQTDRGVADAAMFQTLWQTQVTNVSDESVLVAWHVSGGSGNVVDEWIAFGVAPGESRQEPGYLTNNAGGEAGDLQWRYVDRLVVLADRPECLPAANAPDAETQAKSVAVSVPSAP